jgi:hypothetical protein
MWCRGLVAHRELLLTLLFNSFHIRVNCDVTEFVRVQELSGALVPTQNSGKFCEQPKYHSALGAVIPRAEDVVSRERPKGRNDRLFGQAEHAAINPGTNFRVIVLVDAATVQARKTRWIPSAEPLGCA